MRCVLEDMVSALYVGNIGLVVCSGLGVLGLRGIVG